MKAGTMSVRSKSKKLTTNTTSMGRPKNRSSTSTSGETCSHEARSPAGSIVSCSAADAADARAASAA
jgi:hypothetical protein